MTAIPAGYDHLRLLRPVHVDDLIRLGRDGDGGYVVQRAALEHAEVLAGLGINDDWSFEADVSAHWPAMQVVGVDGSVSAGEFKWQGRIAMVSAAFALLRNQRERARRLHRKARDRFAVSRAFRRFWSDRRFQFIDEFVTIKPGHAVTWSELRTGNTALARITGPHAIFVKMDIEGAEYRVMQDLLRDAAAISGIVVEFHDCDIMRERLGELLEQMLESFAVVHVHANNAQPLAPGTSCPLLLEVSFTNRALLPGQLEPSRHTYPIAGLDQPNAVGRDDLLLDFLTP